MMIANKGKNSLEMKAKRRSFFFISEGI
jgi:hypothetical protein